MDDIGRGRAAMHTRKLHDGAAGLAGVQLWSNISSSIRVSRPERPRTLVVIPRCEHDVGESLLHPLHRQLCVVMDAATDIGIRRHPARRGDFLTRRLVGRYTHTHTHPAMFFAFARNRFPANKPRRNTFDVSLLKGLGQQTIDDCG